MKTKKDVLNQFMCSDFISGVFNYCDRWCETCPFTMRCAVYIMGYLDDVVGLEAQEDVEEELVEEECGQCDNCVPLDLFEDAWGDDWEEADNDTDEDLSIEEWAVEDERRRALVEENEAVLLANDYMNMAGQWFDKGGERLGKEVGKLMRQPPLFGRNPLAEAQEVGARIEILQRYYMMIRVKIQRAVGGDLREVPEIIKDMPRDADGSAKVALIAIDYSIDAWTWLRDYLQEEGDSLLDMLVVLGRLRKTVEANFPDARDFVRPGFDTRQ